MNSTMSDPSNCLDLITLKVIFFSDCEVIFFYLLPNFFTDGRNFCQRDSVAEPDTVGMTIDANVILTDDAGEELNQLRAGEELLNHVTLSVPDQDLKRLLLVGTEHFDGGEALGAKSIGLEKTLEKKRDTG